MKFISQEFIRSIAPQLDLLNTIGGGVAQPQFRIDQRPQGRDGAYRHAYRFGR